MSDPQGFPEEERRVEAEGFDPDFPTTDPEPDDEDVEDDGDDEIEVEDLP
ncbi:hypothetical protein ACWGJP_03520 [Microbacterium sp. NPDC055903]